MNVERSPSRYFEPAVPAEKLLHISSGIGIFSALVGIMVMLGWFFDINFSKSIVSGSLPVRPNTAICLLLSGMSLWLTNNRKYLHKKLNAIPALCSLLITLIAFLSILKYLFEINVGIDELFFKTPAEYADIFFSPKIPPLASVIFLLIGVALFLLNLNVYYRIEQVALVMAWIITLFALIVYSHNVTYSDFYFSRMSIYTIVTLLILIPGILLASPDKGIMEVLFKESFSGMMARRILPFAFIVPFLLSRFYLMGRNAGLYERETGIAIFSILTGVIFLGFAWAIVYYLHLFEKDKIKTEVALSEQEIYLKNFQNRVNEILEILLQYTQMDFSTQIKISEKGDLLDAIALGLNTLGEELEISITSEKASKRELEKAMELLLRKNKKLSDIAEINDITKGLKKVDQLARDILQKICISLGVKVAALYVREDEDFLKFAAGYAFDKPEQKATIRMGEGVIGQAAMDNRKIILSDMPETYFKIFSVLGEMPPKYILIAPFSSGDNVMGVVELGYLEPFSKEQNEYLELVLGAIGIAFNVSISKSKLEKLFNQIKNQAEELQSQKTELLNMNAELSKHMRKIQASEEELKEQKSKLLKLNAELSKGTRDLIEKNAMLKIAARKVEEKAEELRKTSQYKSEFLANMSHELRTPLNSILILSKLLEENKNQRLSEKEIEYAKIIQKSGKDLLNLINDILDLNKVEAGKVELVKEQIYFKQLEQNIYNTFNNFVLSKSIQFKIEIEASLKDEYIYSDIIRLEQVLRNLLSNAFKFTREGGQIILRIAEEKNKKDLTKQSLLKAERVISFSVIDTGIGIPANKIELIFDSFRQADSSTSRKYGGTGLGLYITREIVNLLGGEIKVKSKENEGSEFTVFLKDMGDQDQEEELSQSVIKEHIPEPYSNNSQTDELKEKEHNIPNKLEEEKKLDIVRDHIADLSIVKTLSGKTILLAEDDMRNVFSLTAALNAYNMRILHAADGKEVLEKLNNEQSIDLILMDIMMPEMNGFEAMEKIRKKPEYKKLPIIALTAKAMKGDREKCIEAGASDYISKPIDISELVVLLSKYLKRGK